MTPVPQPVPRRHWPVLAFTLVFASCIVGSWAWFNTDIGRRHLVSRATSDERRALDQTPEFGNLSGSRPSTLDSRPRIWLTARTNLAGYTFVPELVSDDGLKTLLATRIRSMLVAIHHTRLAPKRTSDPDVLVQRNRGCVRLT